MPPIYCWALVKSLKFIQDTPISSAKNDPGACEVHNCSLWSVSFEEHPQCSELSRQRKGDVLYMRLKSLHSIGGSRIHPRPKHLDNTHSETQKNILPKPKALIPNVSWSNQNGSIWNLILLVGDGCSDALMAILKHKWKNPPLTHRQSEAVEWYRRPSESRMTPIGKRPLKCCRNSGSAIARGAKDSKCNYVLRQDMLTIVIFSEVFFYCLESTKSIWIHKKTFLV